jgi:hypothetical protein
MSARKTLRISHRAVAIFDGSIQLGATNSGFLSFTTTAKLSDASQARQRIWPGNKDDPFNISASRKPAGCVRQPA